MLHAPPFPLFSASNTPAHRIAVSNIAVSCTVQSNDVPFVLAIQNDNAYRRGRTEFGAIGGGAIVTTAGMTALQIVAPINFEPHDDGMNFDARMTLYSERFAARRLHALRILINWGRTQNTRVIELDLMREIVEELMDDTPGILSRDDIGTIQTKLVGWKLGAQRSSSRGMQGVATTPLYYCHTMHFTDPAVLERLLADPHGRVRRITSEELATTEGGRKEGRTEDGHILFSNVFPVERVRKF